MFGYVYKIINKINNKAYIGQTTCRISSRWYEHKKYSKNIKNNTVLAKAMRKYDISNFDIKCICWCETQEQLDYRESYYIKLYKTLNPNGYNLTTGGWGGKKSLETRQKMREANLGRKCSEETKKKISDSQKGSKSSWWGRKHTQQTKDKIRKGNTGKQLSLETRQKISQKKKGTKASEETRLKLSIARKKRKPMLGKKHSEASKLKISMYGSNRKYPIKCLENGKVYMNSRKAAEDLNITMQSIASFFHRSTKTAKGFTFVKVSI